MTRKDADKHMGETICVRFVSENSLSNISSHCKKLCMYILRRGDIPAELLNSFSLFHRICKNYHFPPSLIENGQHVSLGVEYQ